MNRQTITVKEVATLIGVSKDLIYELVREKKIPHIKIGKRILFAHVNINNWLNEIQNDSYKKEKCNIGKDEYYG
ncbi:helix-turn-helix domain-containing protein [Priestia megaterium]|uniref:helix-turn-helix domain-containing protein n=1 Tax=Priestia megaterium TaxID=1404 RepID=UPI000BF612C4|nr:helix-turn-helix domain-containing protein [Priestia megaterium]PFR94851.1 DNA-binding protein [Priestia megaterium]